MAIGASLPVMSVKEFTTMNISGTCWRKWVLCMDLQHCFCSQPGEPLWKESTYCMWIEKESFSLPGYLDFRQISQPIKAYIFIIFEYAGISCLPRNECNVCFCCWVLSETMTQQYRDVMLMMEWLYKHSKYFYHTRGKAGTFGQRWALLSLMALSGAELPKKTTSQSSVYRLYSGCKHSAFILWVRAMYCYSM